MPEDIKPKLTFNGKDISELDAYAKLKEIYGDRRATEVIKGLADGTHSCASVSGGYLELKKTQIV